MMADVYRLALRVVRWHSAMGHARVTTIFLAAGAVLLCSVWWPLWLVMLLCPPLALLAELGADVLVRRIDAHEGWVWAAEDEREQDERDAGKVQL